MKNHGTQTFEKEKSYAVILEFVNTLDALNFGRTEGKENHQGFSFASSEADNPPAGGGCRRQPGG